MKLLYISFFSFLSSYLICYLFIKFNVLRKIFIDVPTNRSMHKLSTPRSGGAIILLVLLMFLNLNGLNELNKYFIFLSPLILINLIDDSLGVSFIYKLLAQIITIFLTITYVSEYNISFSAFLIILITLWFINSINFADGINGFIGAYFFIGSLILLIFSISMELKIINAILSFSLFGFLLHNLADGKIFLGDVGSICIPSFVIIYAYDNHLLINENTYLFFIYFLPILMDTTLTILKRLTRLKNIFVPHKSHYYQRLSMISKSNYNVIFLYMGISCLNIIIYSIFIKFFSPFPLTIFITAITFLFFILIDKIFLNENY